LNVDDSTSRHKIPQEEIHAKMKQKREAIDFKYFSGEKF